MLKWFVIIFSGGAFIKVESGEMYRVQSIQSQEDSEDETDIDVSRVCF